MKKIIALSALLTLGFGFTASAQQTKVATATTKTLPATEAAITAAAKKNIIALNGVIALDDKEKGMFQELFETKYKMLNGVAKSGNSQADKDQVYKSIEMKLRASFTPEKMAKLDAKPAVLKQLTHE